MLPLDLWQHCIIDYLQYEDQCNLIQCIKGLELTNLVGMTGLSDSLLKEYKYVMFLDAISNYSITDEGIAHLYLHTLYTDLFTNITDKGIAHMYLHTFSANRRITNEGIAHMNLHTLQRGYYTKITDEGIAHMDIVNLMDKP